MPKHARASLLSAAVLTACAAWPATADGRGTWQWPVTGDVITPFANGADPYAAGRHRGMDIAAAEGAPVVAAAAGTVRHAGSVGRSGIVVSIRTADGRHDTSYLHLARADVARGDRVRAGRRLGTVGTTGRRSAEPPHLHFGVRRAGERHAYLDPLRLLGPPSAAGPPETPAPPLVPVERVRPVPGISPRPVPIASQRGRLPAARPRPAPAGGADRRPAARPAAAPAPLAGPRPITGVPPQPAPAPRLPAVVSPESRPPATAPRAREISLGWLAACGGLLAVAALLARPARRAAAHGSPRPSPQRA